MIFSQLGNEMRRFFRKEERFLLIEIEQKSLAVSQAFVRWGDKKIRIAHTWSAPISWVDDTEKAIVFIKKTCSNVSQLSRYKVVCTVEPRLATTVHASAKIIRQENTNSIDEADLDNCISQAIWQVFDRYRVWSSEKMGIEELDLILSDVRIRNFHVDGHRVLRPVGFPARLIEVFLSQTFTSRNFSSAIHILLPRNKSITITEAGVSGAEIIARAEKMKSFSFVHFTRAASMVYGLRASDISVEKAIYLDTFNIGFIDLYTNVGERLFVDAGIVRSIINRHLARDTSPTFAKKFEYILKQEWALFCDGVASILTESRDMRNTPRISVFVYTTEHLPEFLYEKSVRTKDKRRIELHMLSFDTLRKKLGFELTARRSVSFLGIAGLLDVHYYSDDAMNKYASRRLRWLMPPAER